MKKNIDFAEYLATNGKYFAEIDKKKRKIQAVTLEEEATVSSFFFFLKKQGKIKLGDVYFEPSVFRRLAKVEQWAYLVRQIQFLTKKF